MNLVLMGILFSLPAFPGAPACEPVDFSEEAPATATKQGCFLSAATGGPVQYEVTFPAGYRPGRRLPYVIFLHGRGANDKQFVSAGGPAALSRHVEAGGTPFLVVAPTEPRPSYWKDGVENKLGAARMITQDLIGHLEDPARLGPRTAGERALFGISMGGHGVLYLSQRAPDLFTSVYAISPVFRGPQGLYPEDLPAFGQGADYSRQDPVSLYHERRAKKLPGFPLPNTVAEMGRDDPYFTSIAYTQDFLREWQAEVGPERVNLARPGVHDVSYWRGAVERALGYLGEHFPAPSAEKATGRKKGA